MIHHSEISGNDLRNKIRLGGNRELKIYGTLSCSSGKSMKRQYRVFFSLEQEAQQNNYRTCGRCKKIEYKKWKDGFI